LCRDLVRYVPRVWAQHSHQEILDEEELQKSVRELLRLYREENGAFPDSLLVYRDGVSNGQFDEVLSIEVPAIHKVL
jgi:eukaryotic translation initiation factor 2C